jgi:apolipoprotein D and lipocalin family protein
MKGRLVVLVPWLMAVLSAGTALGGEATGRPTVVDRVDVERYMGLWYAVARIPTTFERRCAAGTTAEYALLEDGTIQVVNTCFSVDGEQIVAKGHAWIPDPAQPGKLKVSFVRFLGLWLFPGDYWILDLDPAYRYAMVGHPKRRYGWILSRTPQLDEQLLDEIVTRLEQQGYDFGDFVRVDPWTPPECAQIAEP